jgi:hypothetical protein
MSEKKNVCIIKSRNNIECNGKKVSFKEFNRLRKTKNIKIINKNNLKKKSTSTREFNKQRFYKFRSLILQPALVLTIIIFMICLLFFNLTNVGILVGISLIIALISSNLKSKVLVKKVRMRSIKCDNSAFTIASVGHFFYHTVITGSLYILGLDIFYSILFSMLFAIIWEIIEYFLQKIIPEFACESILNRTMDLIVASLGSLLVILFI